MAAGRSTSSLATTRPIDPTAAVSETRRLILREKVSVLIGPMASQFALASIPIATQAKVAQIVTAGAGEIVPSFAPYAFSINPSAEAQGTLMADYVAQQLGSKSTAILFDDGPQSRDGLTYVNARLKSLGITTTGTQFFHYRSADKTPQLLSLRNGSPDSLIIWANSPEDFATILTGLKQIGWAPRMSGAIAETMFAPPTLAITGPAPLSAVAGVSYTGWTYCPGEPQSDLPFVAFKQRVKAFEPEKFATIASTIVGWTYDAVYIMKAAIEGLGGKTDGPAIAKWIEANVSTVPAVSAKLSAGPDTRFLVGASGMTMVNGLQSPSPDGLYQRAACSKA